ncbi:MAG: class I SAM-dependent methyltransferase [Lachnospiraceae bacterium]|nr:class I SAM-dependent methyltransferase [Lachnospiraceae bacterium]
MDIKDKRIDEGKAFDWGKTSEYYARYRDIYPEEFYQKVADRGLCIAGQKVLDLGTGTGVLPRNMYRYGAEWIGTDISPEQIEQAKRLAAESGMNIRFETAAAEQIDFPAGSFDVITACQCFLYFDHKRIAPMLHRILKKDGRIVILYMAWLPFEDEIAGKSEELVRRFNPAWSGGGETKRPIRIPDVMFDYFDPEDHEEYDLKVPFTRESWHGRMIACRGVGASLSSEDLARWEAEHRKLLEHVPDRFDVQHYAALAVLKRKERYAGQKQNRKIH